MASSQTASPRAGTPSGGSRTIEVRPQPVLRLSAPSGVLRLRAEPSEQRRIQWAEDVIDNEGMGKKSSKGIVEITLILEVCITNSTGSVLHLPQTPRRRRVFRRRVFRRFVLRFGSGI